MLNVYSRTRDGETLLSRSFRAKEFACKDGTDPLFVDSELVQVCLLYTSPSPRDRG